MSGRAPLARLLRRFGAEERAVAAVEFALILPFLLLLYFGSMEAAALFSADKRVNSVAATLGDLVAQWDMGDGKLPQATWNDYLAASSLIITPYPSTGLKVVVTLVQVKNDGSTRILWSEANAAGTPRTVNAAYPGLDASTMMNSVARGGCIVVAEASYSYVPMLGKVFEQALTLSHSNFFLPRYGSDSALNLWNKSAAGNACKAV